jgi:tetratricopeptide (TPR) repeat protein
MTKKRNDLFKNRGTTRHFLFFKSDTGRLKKRLPATADKASETLKTQFPGMLAGQAFINHVVDQLNSARQFGAMAIRVDGAALKLPESGDNHENTPPMAAASLLESFCQTENGLWGSLAMDILGCAIPEKNETDCLEYARSFQETVSQQTDTTVSIGVAAYPTSEFEKHQILDNACKALDHAAFFGPNSRVAFDAISLNISGDKLYEGGDIKGAINEFERALLLDPANVNVYNSLGVCHGLTGQHEKAIQALEKAISLDSDELLAIYNLGLVNMLASNRKEALNCFLKAQSINGDLFEVVFQTGKLYLEMGQADESKEFLERAAQLNPETGSVYRYLGECYAGCGMPDAAISAYKKAVKYSPNDAASISALGSLFDDTGENPEIALMFCRESVKLSPDNGLFRYRLGRLYYKLDRFNEALQEFKKAKFLGVDAPEYIEKIQTRLTAEAS